MDWQPIETAPKDGRWIDLWRGKCDGGRWQPRVTAKWDAYLFAFVWPDECYDPWHELGRCESEMENGNYYMEYAEGFTHWMPLPPPPHTGDTP